MLHKMLHRRPFVDNHLSYMNECYNDSLTERSNHSDYSVDAPNWARKKVLIELMFTFVIII